MYHLQAITDVIEKQKHHISNKLRSLSPSRSVSRGDRTDRSHISTESYRRSENKNKDDTSISISISEDQSQSINKPKADFFNIKDLSELEDAQPEAVLPTSDSKKSFSIEEDISVVSDDSINDTSINFSVHSFKDLPNEKQDYAPNITQETVLDVKNSSDGIPSVRGREDNVDRIKQPSFRESDKSESETTPLNSLKDVSNSSANSVQDPPHVDAEDTIKTSITEEVSEEVSRPKSARRSLQEYLDGLSPQLPRIPTSTDAMSYTLTFDEDEDLPSKESEHAFLTDLREKSVGHATEDQGMLSA